MSLMWLAAISPPEVATSAARSPPGTVPRASAPAILLRLRLRLARPRLLPLRPDRERRLLRPLHNRYPPLLRAPRQEITLAHRIRSAPPRLPLSPEYLRAKPPLGCPPPQPLSRSVSSCTAARWLPAVGKAGEDRVHIVVSEEYQWLFIRIYDGFNGPEAPEFLVNNLYQSVFDELRGIFWDEVEEHASDDTPTPTLFIEEEEEHKPSRRLWEFLQEESEHWGLGFAGSGRFVFSLSKLRNGLGSWTKDGSWNWLPRWRYDSDDKVKVALDRPKGCRRWKAGPVGDHQLVLRALSWALEVTELAYLEMTYRAMDCNPEEVVMGSCFLVALMRGDDVYVMNVGVSRAIVAQYRPQEMVHRRTNGGVEMHLAEDTLQGAESVEVDLHSTKAIEFGALQLSTDHITSIRGQLFQLLPHQITTDYGGLTVFG